MESMTENESATTKTGGDTGGSERSTRAQDRVTLGRREVEKVEAWLRLVNDSTKGYLTLSKSDIVNYLVRSHKAELGTKDLNQIRADHYDPVRHIAWIAPQIKAALAGGDHARVLVLQKELHGVTLAKSNTSVDFISANDDTMLVPKLKRRVRKGHVDETAEHENRISAKDQTLE